MEIYLLLKEFCESKKYLEELYNLNCIKEINEQIQKVVLKINVLT